MPQTNVIAQLQQLKKGSILMYATTVSLHNSCLPQTGCDWALRFGLAEQLTHWQRPETEKV